MLTPNNMSKALLSNARCGSLADIPGKRAKVCFAPQKRTSRVYEHMPIGSPRRGSGEGFHGAQEHDNFTAVFDRLGAA